MRHPPSFGREGRGGCKGLLPAPPLGYVARVFWLIPPPYLRWLAAALVFGGAAYLDFAAPPTEPYPFAARSIESGEPLAEGVEWRDVPAGLLPPSAALEDHAARQIAAGEPLTGTAARPDDGIPAGWWSVPVALPVTAAPGTPVRLVAQEAALDVTGFVTESATTGAFATPSMGLVAVAPDVAADVAAAGAAGRLIVLLGT